MKTITVKLDYATMRFLKEMLKEIKEIKNISRRGSDRKPIRKQSILDPHKTGFMDLD